MKVRDMVAHVNRLTGLGTHSVDDLLPYFDECIDEINETLHLNLPPVTAIYENKFTKEDYEKDLTFVSPGYQEDGHEALDNEYTRVFDRYLRNYVCYETSYRVLRDEDEDEAVYIQRAHHARNWFQKMISKEGDFNKSVGDTILVNDDVPVDPYDFNFYNAYWDYGDDK